MMVRMNTMMHITMMMVTVLVNDVRHQTACIVMMMMMMMMMMRRTLIRIVIEKVIAIVQVNVW